MPGRTIIQFRCVSSEHAEPSVRPSLTIHQGKWAYCAHEGATSEHEWQPAGAVELRDLLNGRAVRRP
jgi:hypothetical protein